MFKNKKNKKEIIKFDKKMCFKIDEKIYIYQKYLVPFVNELDEFLEEWENKKP